MRPYFTGPHFSVRELAHSELPALQALFEASPSYFRTVGGQAPRPDEAQQEFDEQPPAHLPHGDRWFAGIHAADGALHGLLILVRDFCTTGVWHTALFWLDDASRGTGLASEVQRALEACARQQGAQWLRLAVIQGNTPGERFWTRCGYTEVRTRDHVNAAGEARLARVMVKPLAGGTVAQYLARVPRDQPGSTLP